MKLKNGYEITGIPNRAEYHKNDNGLYTVDIKEFICIKPDGQKYKCYLRFPNTEIPVEDEEGTIELNLSDIEFYSADNESNSNTIFEFIAPDVKERKNSK